MENRQFLLCVIIVCCSQDFATQVHFWQDYRRQCDLVGSPYQKHVTPELAEHMSGQILSISTFDISVNLLTCFDMFNFEASRGTGQFRRRGLSGIPCPGLIHGWLQNFRRQG